MAGPCTGLTVLDFSWGMPGALCTLVMADFGADVIKVEPPGGDPFRFQPAWISWNRGKKGVVLDLGTTEGRAHAIELVGAADVLVESFRPGDMADWGLAYDTLSQRYPRLVYCSITGFGQKGPLGRVKGYEGVVAAKAGRMLNLQGQPNRDGPVYSAVPTGSWHASQAALRGIIAALRVRDLCGRGQWVQTSIVQSLASPHDNNIGDGGLVNVQMRRRDPQRFRRAPRGRGESSIGYIPVRTKDGAWLQHANQRVPHIQGHLKAIGLGHLLEDERFARVPAISAENRELLRREILKKQLEKTADEWMEIYLQDGEIAAEPYRNSIQAMNHPAVLANGTVATIDDPRVGPLRTLAPLADFQDTPGAPSGPAPDVGQHNAEVLGRLRQQAAAASGGVSEAACRQRAGPPAVGRDHPRSGDRSGRAVRRFHAGRPWRAGDQDRRHRQAPRRGAALDGAGPGRRTNLRRQGMPCRSTCRPPRAKRSCTSSSPRPMCSRTTIASALPSVSRSIGRPAGGSIPAWSMSWMGTYGEHGVHARRPGAHPIPGAIMGGAMRQMGRGMPPPPEAVMDIEEIAEATRWIMKSNWGPDQNTSAAVATGIILGLRARDLSGKGQPVSVTMLNANAWTNADEYYDYANRPPIAVPDAEIHGLHALYRLYRCREGWVFLGCLFQDEWETFCRTVQRRDLLADRRFATREARQANDEALITEIAGIFAGRTAAEWEELLHQSGHRLCPGRRSVGGRVLCGPSSRQGQCAER